MTAKKGFIDDTINILKTIVDKMQETVGCLSVQLVEDVIHREKFKIYEKWISLEKQHEFVDFLRSEGLIEQLRNTLSEGPFTEIYPTTK